MEAACPLAGRLAARCFRVKTLVSEIYISYQR